MRPEFLSFSVLFFWERLVSLILDSWLSFFMICFDELSPLGWGDVDCVSLQIDGRPLFFDEIASQRSFLTCLCIGLGEVGSYFRQVIRSEEPEVLSQREQGLWYFRAGVFESVHFRKCIKYFLELRVKRLNFAALHVGDDDLAKHFHGFENKRIVSLLLLAGCEPRVDGHVAITWGML